MIPPMPKLLAQVNVTHLRAKWGLTVLLRLAHCLSVVFSIHLEVEILSSGDVKIY